jgi:mono/diheme cytochrome c family protein
MTRQTQTFSIPIPQSGTFIMKNALIISALALVSFGPVFAAKPVTVNLKSSPAHKDVEATVNNKAATGKVAADKSVADKIANGKKLFDKLTCSGCHPNGENSLHPYRPLKGPGFLARYKEDGQIEGLIRTGVLKAGMPSFSKARLNDKDMKDLIAYIRSLTPTTLKK